MSDILNRIKSGAGKVAKEADRAVDIKRIEMQIGSINNKLEEEYQKLGQLVYENNLLGSDYPDAAAIIENIGDLNAQIEEKRKEIEAINKEPASPVSVAANGKLFCPECGAQNNANSKFCSSCGKKLS